MMSHCKTEVSPVQRIMKNYVAKYRNTKGGVKLRKVVLEIKLLVGII